MKKFVVPSLVAALFAVTVSVVQAQTPVFNYDTDAGGGFGLLFSQPSASGDSRFEYAPNSGAGLNASGAGVDIDLLSVIACTTIGGGDPGETITDPFGASTAGAGFTLRVTDADTLAFHDFLISGTLEMTGLKHGAGIAAYTAGPTVNAPVSVMIGDSLYTVTFVNSDTPGAPGDPGIPGLESCSTGVGAITLHVDQTAIVPEPGLAALLFCAGVPGVLFSARRFRKRR